MNTKRKLSFNALLGIIFVVLVFSVSVGAVYSYFTATANKDVTLNFATLTIDLSTSSNVFTVNEKTVTKLTPGDTLYFEEIEVQNTGNADAYVLINVKAEIKKDENNILIFEKWLNADGTEIDVSKIATNEVVGASYIVRYDENSEEDSLIISDVELVLVGAEIDDSFQEKEVKVSVSAYAVQAYFPTRPNTYSTDAKYATYFIYTNYSNFKSLN